MGGGASKSAIAETDVGAGGEPSGRPAPPSPPTAATPPPPPPSSPPQRAPASPAGERAKIQALEMEARRKIKELKDENAALHSRLAKLNSLQIELGQTQRALNTEVEAHDASRRQVQELQSQLAATAISAGQHHHQQVEEAEAAEQAQEQAREQALRGDWAERFRQTEAQLSATKESYENQLSELRRSLEQARRDHALERTSRQALQDQLAAMDAGPVGSEAYLASLKASQAVARGDLAEDSQERPSPAAAAAAAGPLPPPEPPSGPRLRRSRSTNQPSIGDASATLVTADEQAVQHDTATEECRARQEEEYLMPDHDFQTDEEEDEGVYSHADVFEAQTPLRTPHRYIPEGNKDQSMGWYYKTLQEDADGCLATEFYVEAPDGLRLAC